MDVSKDIFSLLTQLMPGFITAWVVYGLTTYSKPAQFERIVQALIYSFIVKALVSLCKITLLYAGKFIQLGYWEESTELFASVSIGIILGVILSFFMTNDCFFSLARKLGLTTRTVFPSEWYGAFAAGEPKYIVLHIDGERRIMGYPIEWPSEPLNGHFRLIDAAWLLADNTEVSLAQNESILIPAKQVEIVELLKIAKENPNGSKTPQPPSATSTSSSCANSR